MLIFSFTGTLVLLIVRTNAENVPDGQRADRPFVEDKSNTRCFIYPGIEKLLAIFTTSQLFGNMRKIEKINI